MFDPLLILYICPLTKKLSLYLNSERQNNNKENQEQRI